MITVASVVIIALLLSDASITESSPLRPRLVRWSVGNWMALPAEHGALNEAMMSTGLASRTDYDLDLAHASRPVW